MFCVSRIHFAVAVNVSELYECRICVNLCEIAENQTSDVVNTFEN